MLWLLQTLTQPWPSPTENEERATCPCHCKAWRRNCPWGSAVFGRCCRPCPPAARPQRPILQGFPVLRDCLLFSEFLYCSAFHYYSERPKAGQFIKKWCFLWLMILDRWVWGFMWWWPLAGSILKQQEHRVQEIRSTRVCLCPLGLCFLWSHQDSITGPTQCPSLSMSPPNVSTYKQHNLNKSSLLVSFT